MKTIYSAVFVTGDRGNYPITNDSGKLFEQEEDAILYVTRLNVPYKERLATRNAQEAARTKQENAEYEALVNAGLRESREPRTPWMSTNLPEYWKVISVDLYELGEHPYIRRESQGNRDD